MSRSLKIAIVRVEESEDSTLEPSLLAIDGVHLVAELKPTDDLLACMNQTRPDVLILVLGESSTEERLSIVSDVIRHKRDISVVLAGPHRDPDLLLSAMRSGVREFFQLPTKPENLIETLQKILEIQPTRQSGKLMLFHGSGGGCGCSTVTCNMAVEIARSGRGRVAMVDLDFHTGQLAAMLDLFPTYTMLDLCQLEGEDIEAARVESALLKHSSGVRMLARPKEVLVEDRRLLHRALNVIHVLQDLFDYVLVDFDLHSDVTDGKLVRMADELILVSQPVISSIRNASDSIRILENQGLDLDRLRLVLNRIPRKLGSVRVDNVEKSLKRNVFWEIPDDYASVSESVNLGVPLSEHATSSKARCSIRDLAMALLRSDAGTIREGGKKEGFLKRIFTNNVA